ncbi:phytanoyl-CoA dioxygenase family protein [Candidatus Laterigemmans baculatus]|uniref:phytanoyl-CoA dioxygenase family protein n=1 Tax=Candidatus Laterigemmans baculatus TaxID=2770505 RepID=UPI0013D8F89C|nr:phytanoyl-CoA dioxygenase family protein [Candidatus Laterigemmans baculatus]
MNDSQWIESYHRDGVIRCRGWFSADQLSEIRAAFERYRSDVAPELPDADYTLESDRTTVRNFWRMNAHDPFFQSLAERPELLELVAPLVQGEPVLMGVESFNKPARVGSPVPPHQDNAYFCQRPPDVLSVWIALDPATEENGAVEYFLGSQHTLLPHKPSGVKGNSFGLADASAADRFPSFLGTVDAGDMLVHHCQTIHQSQPNRSASPRLSLVIVYRAAHTETDNDLQQAYRQALAATPQNA